MAGLSAVEFQGTRFFWSTSTALSTAQEVLGGLDISGLGGTAPVIDVTDTNSTAREKKMGLRDPGEGSLTVNVNPSTVLSPGLRAMEQDAGTRVKRKFAIKFSTVDANGIGWKADAYCGGVDLSGSVDDVLKGSVQIIFAGGGSYTTFTT